MAKYGEVVATLLFVLFAIGGITLSLQLPLGTPLEPMPGFVPLIVCSFLLCVSVVQLVVAIRSTDLIAEELGEAWQRPAALIVGLLTYSLALDYAGYIIATFALSLLIMRILEPDAWVKPIVISLGLTIFSYLLFDRLLDVNLPEGPLTSLLNQTK